MGGGRPACLNIPTCTSFRHIPLLLAPHLVPNTMSAKTDGGSASELQLVCQELDALLVTFMERLERYQSLQTKSTGHIKTVRITSICLISVLEQSNEAKSGHEWISNPCRRVCVLSLIDDSL